MKGNRKRSSVKQVKKAEAKPIETKQEETLPQMIERKLKELCPVKGFSQHDANLVNTAFKLGNNIAQLKQQYVNDRTIIANKKNLLKQIDSGVIKPPFLKQLGDVSVFIYDKNEYRKSVLAEIEEYEKMNQLTVNQIRSNYSGYIDTLNNFYSIVTEMLSHIPKEQKVISPHRGITQQQEDERRLFEQQFAEELKKQEIEDRKKLDEIKQKVKVQN